MDTQIWFVGPKGDYSEKIKYSTISECLEYCNTKQILAEDIETSPRYKKGGYNELAKIVGTCEHPESSVWMEEWLDEFLINPTKKILEP